MKKYCFGVDVGGTTIKLGLFDADGIVLDKWEVPTHTENEGEAILPDLAKEAGAAVVGTGRSDYPNQINNVLAFPGIFRGALDCGAREINYDMKMAAAAAIAELVSDEELAPDFIIPDPFNPEVARNVARRVAEAARRTGAVRE